MMIKHEQMWATFYQYTDSYSCGVTFTRSADAVIQNEKYAQAVV